MKSCSCTHDSRVTRSLKPYYESCNDTDKLFEVDSPWKLCVKKR